MKTTVCLPVLLLLLLGQQHAALGASFQFNPFHQQQPGVASQSGGKPNNQNQLPPMGRARPGSMNNNKLHNMQQAKKKQEPLRNDGKQHPRANHLMKSIALPFQVESGTDHERHNSHINYDALWIQNSQQQQKRASPDSILRQRQQQQQQQKPQKQEQQHSPGMLERFMEKFQMQSVPETPAVEEQKPSREPTVNIFKPFFVTFAKEEVQEVSSDRQVVSGSSSSSKNTPVSFLLSAFPPLAWLQNLWDFVTRSFLRRQESEPAKRVSRAAAFSTPADEYKAKLEYYSSRGNHKQDFAERASNEERFFEKAASTLSHNNKDKKMKVQEPTDETAQVLALPPLKGPELGDTIKLFFQKDHEITVNALRDAIVNTEARRATHKQTLQQWKEQAAAAAAAAEAMAASSSMLSNSNVRTQAVYESYPVDEEDQGSNYFKNDPFTP